MGRKSTDELDAEFAVFLEENGILGLFSHRDHKQEIADEIQKIIRCADEFHVRAVCVDLDKIYIFSKFKLQDWHLKRVRDYIISLAK